MKFNPLLTFFTVPRTYRSNFFCRIGKKLGCFRSLLHSHSSKLFFSLFSNFLQFFLANLSRATSFRTNTSGRNFLRCVCGVSYFHLMSFVVYFVSKEHFAQTERDRESECEKKKILRTLHTQVTFSSRTRLYGYWHDLLVARWL